MLAEHEAHGRVTKDDTFVNIRRARDSMHIDYGHALLAQTAAAGRHSVPLAVHAARYALAQKLWWRFSLPVDNVIIVMFRDCVDPGWSRLSINPVVQHIRQRVTVT